MSGYPKGVDQDDVGYYAYWGFGENRRETLRTPDLAKAKMWLFRGCCHGANNHDKTCANCDAPGFQVQAFR
jgi:hypothetical protein